jgi:hypothetical protein
VKRSAQNYTVVQDKSTNESKPSGGTETKPSGGTEQKPSEGNEQKPSEGNEQKPSEGTETKPSEGTETTKPSKGNPNSQVIPNVPANITSTVTTAGTTSVSDTDSSSESEATSSTESSSLPTRRTSRTLSGDAGNSEGTEIGVLENGFTITQFDLTSDHILRASLLNKFYGQNTLLAAIMQSNFGLMIDMSQVPVVQTDLEITYNVSTMSELAPEFNTVMIKANNSGELGFDGIFNFTVGDDCIGKTAYVYRLNDTATGYDLIETTVVNIIGNVAFTSDKFTDFVVFVEK